MSYYVNERKIKLKLENFSWFVVGYVSFFSFLGVALLYSAAQGNWEPWAFKQLLVAAVFLPLMIYIGLVDISLFYKNAYHLYIFGILLLIIAEILGHKAMGAQRWIRLGFINFQPSEIMKLFVILALARYFHNLHFAEIGKIRSLIIPGLIVLFPALLIVKQPNLGTALIIIFLGINIFFMAGVRAWKFIVGIILSVISMPLIWHFMHDYQKKRVLTFLNPESDPLGSGYNIIQSMIAIGSGGFFGKGYLNGSQSQLSFLPEKQTDFVFTILAEEFGFVGVMLIFFLCVAVIIHGYLKTLQVKTQFSRLVVVGVISMFALHVIINTAMIGGSIPVVGTPFPFFSYGGSNLITMTIGFGLVLSALSSEDKLR